MRENIIKIVMNGNITSVMLVDEYLLMRKHLLHNVLRMSNGGVRNVVLRMLSLLLLQHVTLIYCRCDCENRRFFTILMRDDFS